MLWDKANKLTDTEFKRKVGYYKEVILKMIEVVDSFKHKARLKDKRGNSSNFSSNDEVLIMICYYREYACQPANYRRKFDAKEIVLNCSKTDILEENLLSIGW